MTTTVPLQASPPSIPQPHKTRQGRLPTLLSLESCANMANLRQFHSQIIRLGLSDDNDTMGRIVKFCAVSDSGDFNYALEVFERIPEPDAFIYNTILRGHLRAQSTRNSIHLYVRMLERSIVPNKFTFPSLIRACCMENAIDEGKQVHAHVFKLGYAGDEFSQNNLIHMYMNCRYLDDGRRVFDKMSCQTVVSWTTLISGYSQWGYVDDAYAVFEMMPVRNSVSWNAMIAAYVQSNRFQEALALFERMRAEGIELDKYVAASMLSACTGLGALEQGEWIHAYIKKSGITLDTKLATTIIDMYCKCGCLEKAFELFNSLSHKGISSWNSMIGGLAIHGQAQAAIELFKEMEKETVEPDDITLVNVLNACAHAGLVQEGQHYFDQMTTLYGLEPKMEHYGCMVDLLGRAGLLKEGKRLMEEMPMKPDAGVLGALVGACKIHGDIGMGEEVGKQLIELDPQNSGRYILLANLYASVGRWDDVADIRRLMNDRGINKSPGCSMIELNGNVSEFIAGGRSHPQSKEIYSKVDEVLERIRTEGYFPDSDGMLIDVGEEEKENPLFYHSEKLAIAYGLLNTCPGATIRISKNLRICKDCHSASKLISKVYDREIVVRDRNRFHHFKDGKCSCKDFW
ncbi:hypothetical protein H6P81_004454 [Aristolochia fimbriata]|uniref:DYW domain-containing protein n=1 Tax=Aristolochia fimbriata TaxID=158543 RepID=A0AAV7FHX0_ARIFI|nr:hypothetical protein H6P81_004454 [Aristolochia fimbriata]